MARFTRVETITAIDMAVFKLHIKNIDEIGIGQFAVVSVFQQDITQDGVVDITNFGMKFLSANAVITITFINGIRVQAGNGACTIVCRIIQQILAWDKGLCNYTTPINISFCIPEPVDGWNT